MWLTFALCAAVAFGLRGILYHKTSTMQLDRNLMLCGVFASGAILNFVMTIITHSEWTVSNLAGIQMGLFSFAASACMYKGFAVGKASIVAILTALPAVIVVTVAFFIWGEKLHFMQLIAFIVLISGILTIRYSNDISLSNLQGAQWGLLAMIFFAGTDLSTKWATMLNGDPYATLVFMFLAGACCFGILWLFDRYKAKVKHSNSVANSEAEGVVLLSAVAHSDVSNSNSQVIRRFTNGQVFGIGLLVGTTNAVGMMLNMQAFHSGKTGLVSGVIALNVLIILLYTRFVVREKFTLNETIGMILAFCGILLIHLFK